MSRTPHRDLRQAEVSKLSACFSVLPQVVHACLGLRMLSHGQAQHMEAGNAKHKNDPDSQKFLRIATEAEKSDYAQIKGHGSSARKREFRRNETTLSCPSPLEHPIYRTEDLWKHWQEVHQNRYPIVMQRLHLPTLEYKSSEPACV